VKEDEQCVGDLRDRFRDVYDDQIEWEAYNKRLYILIHGVEDNKGEDKQQSKLKFDKVLKSRLKIDPGFVSIIDIHRLPQNSNYWYRSDMTWKPRTITVKLMTAFDKTSNLPKYVKSQRL